MPWVRLDDQFHNNRKISLLSANAFRLYVSALCWCSSNLTEGVIRSDELRSIAHVKRVDHAAKELVGRGLWEELDQGWRIHDYLDYNPTRDQVRDDRAANAARQKAFRDRKKAEREIAEAPGDDERNGVTSRVTRNGRNSPPSRPVLPLPTEEESQGQPAGHAGAPDATDVPAVLRPLADALHHAGLRGLRWNLRGDEGLRIHNLMTRKGLDDMTAAAVTAAGRARQPVAHVQYFLRTWQELPNLPTTPPPGSGVPVLHAVGAAPPASTTDARVRQALDAGERLQAHLDAQREQA